MKQVGFKLHGEDEDQKIWVINKKYKLKCTINVKPNPCVLQPTSLHVCNRMHNFRLDNKMENKKYHTVHKNE